MSVELTKPKSDFADSQLRQCPLCGAGRLKPRAVEWKDGLFSLCRACGFLFQDPPPAEAQVRTFYEQDYYDELKPLENRIRQARLPLYQQALRQMAPLKKTGRVLDLGCGFGDFMLAAEKEGWQCWGLDPSREAWGAARKHFKDQVVLGTAESAEFQDGYFDVVTLWNVLDCVSEPLKTLEHIRRWLRPGGRILVRTPNAACHYFFYHLYHRGMPLLNLAGWKKDFTAFHRSNFSGQSLKMCLAAAGFQAIEITNASMTSGDPYGVFSKKFVLRFLKNSAAYAAAILDCMTRGRCLAGSALWAWGEAPGGAGRAAKPAWNLSLRTPLKRAVLYLFSGIGYLMGLPVWSRLGAGRGHVSILLYHSVVGGKPGEMSVRQEDFRRQMLFLKESCDVISLDEAVASLQNPQSRRKPAVAISFDDGYEDNYTFAYPVLRELDLPATIFLLTGRDRGARKVNHLLEDDFYPSRLLSWEQVREMSGHRITFGSHGESHAHLVDLKWQDLQRDLRRSKECIETESAQPVNFFSYPYGTVCDFDRRVMSEAAQAGYRAGFTAVFGGNAPGSELYALKRMSIEASDTLWILSAKLNGALNILCLFHSSVLRRFVRWVDRVFLRRPSFAPSPFRPILLASVDFPPHTDGVSTIARELSCRISAKHSGFHVLAPRDAGDKAFDRDKGYSAVRVPGYDWGQWRAIPMFAGMPLMILRHGIRHVLALNIAYGGVVAWALSHVVKLRYVLFGYGYEFEKVKLNPWLKRLYLAIYQRSAGVVCCSENVRERLTAFGVPAERTLTLYPGVDLRQFFPVPVTEDFFQSRSIAGRRVILTVGRLVERKGHDKVIQALAQLAPRFPELLYVISGKGEDEAGLKQLVTDLHLDNQVCFVGRVSDAEILSYYNACEFFVMPSREIRGSGHVEGFGIVFLEAAACGKPSIGGRSGGVSEAIWDGHTGLLVDPESVDELVLKMETLLKDPQYCSRLGENAREWVQTRFHWPAYVQRVYQLLMGEDLP